MSLPLQSFFFTPLLFAHGDLNLRASRASLADSSEVKKAEDLRVQLRKDQDERLIERDLKNNENSRAADANNKDLEASTSEDLQNLDSDIAVGANQLAALSIWLSS